MPKQDLLGDDGLGAHGLHIAHVQQVEDDTHITLQLRIGDDHKTFYRPVDEPLDKIRHRLQLLAAESAAASEEDVTIDGTRARKARNRRKGKKNRTVDTMASTISVRFITAQNEELISPSLGLGKALLQTSRIVIDEKSFEVLHNQAVVQSITVMEPIFAGIPILPIVDTKCCAPEDCLWQWYYIDDDEIISNQRSFRPSQTDINCRLRVKCHAPLLHSPFAREHIVDYVTSPVTPSPDRSVFSGRKILGTNRANAFDACAFRVMSYNILFSGYVDLPTSNAFNYTSEEALKESYRIQLVYIELEEAGVDIVCLQEMGSTLFHTYLEPMMKSIGFTGHYAMKTGSTHEGCAVFIRTNRFEVLENHVLNLTHVIQTMNDPEILAVLAAFPQIQAALPHLPSIAQLLVLRCTYTQRLVIVVNTHLYFREDAHMLRLLQTAAIIYTIESTCTRIRNNSTLPVAVVFSGDLNSSPHTAPVEFLSQGRVDSSHPNWREAASFEWQHQPLELDSIDQSQVRKGAGHLKHTLNLKSAFGNCDFTNYIDTFIATLDYIFITQSTLEVVQRFPLFTRAQVSTEIALPSRTFPSDHISLVVDLKLK